MWNEKKSVTLSKMCTAVLLAALACFLVIAPGTVKWLMSFTLAGLPDGRYSYFLITVYTGGFLLALLLVFLYLLLDNISKGSIFCEKNTSLLRKISFCCFGGAIISGISTIYYFPWLFIAIAAIFVGLIVRVLKNLLAEAIRIKEENELTI